MTTSSAREKPHDRLNSLMRGLIEGSQQEEQEDGARGDVILGHAGCSHHQARVGEEDADDEGQEGAENERPVGEQSGTRHCPLYLIKMIDC